MESWIPPAPPGPPPIIPCPPDLRRCTRIDVQYDPSTLEFFFTEDELRLLSPGEEERVRRLRTVTIHDPQIIQALASEVGSGQYVAPLKGPFSFRGLIRFHCYNHRERMIAFTAFPDLVVTQEGHWFKYPKWLRSTRYVPPEVEPLLVRTRCASNLVYLYSCLRSHLWAHKPFPSPTEWCDVIRADLESEGESEQSTSGYFKCPTAAGGPCHYAMNANCKPDSPKDMVLLFESRAGWNQNGGPELFTFEDHYPRGGLVLLNDGDWEMTNSPTVRFIRTGEELKQLRWK